LFPFPDDNGFNPYWCESCEFDIGNPEISLIRFAVFDEDYFGDPNFLGQATYPVPCLRTGYRSVQLKNAYSEEMEMASLLVLVEIITVDHESSPAAMSIQQKRAELKHLYEQKTIVVSKYVQAKSDATAVELKTIKDQIDAAEADLFTLHEQRADKWKERLVSTRL
jgi:phosphatidylinositol phospholipase C gamma-1